MFRQGFSRGCVPAFLSVLLASPAAAQSFRVQCPTSTLTHPDASANNGEPAYSGPNENRYVCVPSPIVA